MRAAQHSRFFFALLSSTLVLLLAAAPEQAQSPAQQSPAAAARPPKPDARKARKAFERGLKAEQAGDWPAAFQAYAEAAAYAPDNTDLLLRRETARFQIVQQHTDRAEREALAGRLSQARAKLQQALALDPGYSVARERLAQFEDPAPQQAPPSLAGPVQLQPQPGTRDFNLRADTRAAYTEVARQFGLVASFDSDLPTRLVRFRVAQLDFETAMRILSQQTNTFWRAVDAHTFFVAENTTQKRREYAPVVVRTVLLPASTTPDRMTEVLRLVREIAGIAHTELNTRGRTLTLRDSPENVALATALIQELEQAPGELMLEIELLEVNRDAARRLGITPPSSARLITFSPADVRALQQAQNTAALLAIVQRIFGAGVPPLVAFGGGRTTFLARLPGAAADFSETLSLVRSGRRMLLRAQDGQPATFFIGERFPITLALLGASLVPGSVAPSVAQIAFPRADFPSGTGPVAVAAADFNGDGRLDLAVVNGTSNTVSILLGKGDGTFQPPVDFATGSQPSGIAVGDFNGDSKLDLAITNQGSNNVSILLGNGDGTFRPQVTFATGVGPQAVVARDFNGDGKLDLAVANSADSTVSILPGKGDGTFQPRSDSATGTKPVALAAGDFNGDGKLDLAVANQGSNNVSVLLGRGDGTFQAHVDYGAGTSPSAVAAVDLSRDGKLDLAVANQGSNSVSVLLGKGDGTFNPKTDFQTGNAPAGIASGDFNLDGRLDLVVANQGSNTVSLLLGNGDGSFDTRLELATGSSPSGIIAADLNGDTRPDVAVTNQNGNSVSVILNPAVSIAAATIPQTAYPGAAYEDIGLKVRATPRMHANNEVTLHLDFEIRSLSGEKINGIPVISNRTVSQVVRLRENETTVLSGIVQQEETRAITGLPGFARATAVGHLAGRRNIQQRESELLIVITPRQLRLVSRTDRSIYAGRGETTPGARPPQVPQ